MMDSADAPEVSRAKATSKMVANIETIRKKGKLRSISTNIEAVEEQLCTCVNRV